MVLNLTTGITLLFISLILTSCQDHDNRMGYLPPENALYTGENIHIQLSCGDILAGTLTLPKNGAQMVPAVVLITGSSAHDRDNSKPGVPESAYRPFRQIAGKLSSNGIAVLRMDDRGVGASSGGDITKMTTPERADDIRQCIAYLRNRDEIDGSQIGLVGLSEGASIAHLIASKDQSIACVVLLSGIGSKGKEIIRYQVKNGLINEKDLPEMLKRNKNLKHLYGFDPLKTARHIRQPVLIIHGKTDRRVPFTDAIKLEKAIKSNGNRDVTVSILSGYNHLLLKEHPEGKPTSYGKITSNKIPEEVLNILSDWLVARILPDELQNRNKCIQLNRNH
jgi:hypothetical protein